LLTLRVTPQVVSEQGQRLGRIGASPQMDPVLLERLRVVHRDGPLEAMHHAIERTWDLSIFSLRMMGRMLMGEVSVKNLSGPISIADYAGQSAQAGWIPFVGFLALISISLGVLNLLPIPMLDGGHLLYYLLEWIGGKPVPDRIQELAQRVGIALLLTLMTFALYNDLARLLAT
jgi:regulator of sigma E protease